MAGSGGDDGQLGELSGYVERLRNYERPDNAMNSRRKLNDCVIAGTKGKGSTAAFLSNIMREDIVTQLPGRSHFLTKEETSALGLDGASSLLVDGAKASSDVIETVKPGGPLAVVVGMANVKEHLAFAEQLLSAAGAGARECDALRCEAG
ncbi:hypothetical protein ABZP36_034735 [Zizania latifolia]